MATTTTTGQHETASAEGFTPWTATPEFGFIEDPEFRLVSWLKRLREAAPTAK